ncbi:MAG: hypothetical protein VB144_15215 [Clostridia bacterium]|nr:hypothetical protein [Clostridia bacterium]
MTGAKIFACDGAGDQVFLRASLQGNTAVRIGNDTDFVFVSVRREELDLAVIRYLLCVDSAWERIMDDEAHITHGPSTVVVYRFSRGIAFFGSYVACHRGHDNPVLEPKSAYVYWRKQA